MFLQYARDQFEGLFTQTPATAKQYIEDDRFMDRTMKLPGTQPVRNGSARYIGSANPCKLYVACEYFHLTDNILYRKTKC